MCPSGRSTTYGESYFSSLDNKLQYEPLQLSHHSQGPNQIYRVLHIHNAVTGVLNPNNQYNIYWIKYSRLSMFSFSPRFFLKLNLLPFSCKSFQIKPSPMNVS